MGWWSEVHKRGPEGMVPGVAPTPVDGDYLCTRTMKEVPQKEAQIFLCGFAPSAPLRS